jgi:hypothetical protein
MSRKKKSRPAPDTAAEQQGQASQPAKRGRPRKETSGTTSTWYTGSQTLSIVRPPDDAAPEATPIQQEVPAPEPQPLAQADQPPAEAPASPAEVASDAVVPPPTETPAEPAIPPANEPQPQPAEASAEPAPATPSAAAPPAEAQASPATATEPPAPAGDKKLSALDAAARVLAEAGTPLTCKEMIEAMAARGYWTSPGGKTPQATLYSAILREIAVKGDAARFAKTERGKFGLRTAAGRGE